MEGQRKEDSNYFQGRLKMHAGVGTVFEDIDAENDDSLMKSWKIRHELATGAFLSRRSRQKYFYLHLNHRKVGAIKHGGKDGAWERVDVNDLAEHAETSSSQMLNQWNEDASREQKCLQGAKHWLLSFCPL
uniref:PH domain-containing protein n=1 Tax=Ascaris lumbricoides TaxID=6252 RepID=A0A0M3I2S1_ASCLU